MLLAVSQLFIVPGRERCNDVVWGELLRPNDDSLLE